MELTIMQQTVKGGGEVLMVRHGKRPIIGFPLTMPDLAQAMVQEARSIDEKDVPDVVALLDKYKDMKNWHQRNDTSPAPTVAPISQPEPEAVSPVAAPPVYVDGLADLLRCAQQAEIEYAAAQGVYHEAAAALEYASQKADHAWGAFNDALRRELPDGSQIAVTRLNQQ